MREERAGLAADVEAKEADPDATKRGIRKARRRLELKEREIAPAETTERAEHKARRAAALRTYHEQKAAHEAGARQRQEAEKKRGKLGTRRREICERVGQDIERVFAAGGPGAGASAGGRVVRAGGGKRLPWRVLPPGELTREGVIGHYRGLARAYPGRRFEWDRIEKAFSLGPVAWWEGSADFGGYVVFEYPGTERVLLECGLSGNAIYVLGPNWKKLSRLSKPEVKGDPSTRWIPHRGEWFETVRAELGLR